MSYLDRKKHLAARPANLVVLAVVLSILSGCRECRSPRSLEPECSYGIGAVFPLTGELSDFGKTASEGLALAFPPGLKTGSGCAIKLLVADGRGDVNASVTAYDRLRSDGANLIVTNVSGVSLALADRARREDVVLFADAAHPRLTPEAVGSDAVPHVFRHSSVATQEATLFVQAIERLARPGAPARVAVSVLNNDYGVVVLDRLKEQLASKPSLAVLVNETRFDPTDTEFMAVAFDIRRARPDIAILVGYSRSLGLLLNFLKDGGYRGAVLCSVGFLATQDSVNVAGQNAEGVLYNAFRLDTMSPQYRAFHRRYVDEFRREPSQVAVLMHNTGLLIRHVLQQGDDTSPSSIARQLLSVRRFVGAGESMTIESNGDVLPDLGLAEHHENGLVWLDQDQR